VAGAVEDAEDHDGVVAANEEDAVGKSLHQHPTHLWLAAKTRVTERIRGGAGDGRFDFGEEIVAEARLLSVLPDGGVGDVDLCFNADDDTKRVGRHGCSYGRSLARTRFVTSSQELPASGDFS